MELKPLLSIFLCTTLLTLSCIKEPISEQEDASNGINDEQLVKKVENFIQLAKAVKEGKILKSGEKMPIEEAINYIESSFNYAYCFPDPGYVKLLEIKTDIKIPVLSTEDKVYLVDALTAYNNAVSASRAKYITVAETTKRLFALCVNNKGVDLSGDNIDVEITGIIAIGSRPMYILNEDENPGFWWTNGGGSCEWEPPHDPIFGIGAPEVITDNVNFAFKPAPPYGYRMWYNNYSPLYTKTPTPEYINPDGIQNDNLCDYWIYKAVGSSETLPNYVKCLAVQNGEDELHFYSSAARYVIESVKIQDLTFFQLSSTRDYFNISIDAYQNNVPPFLYHQYKVQLADRHIAPVSMEYPIDIEIIDL